MNRKREHGTLKFTLSHMNAFLFETREYLKMSSDFITQDDFKNIQLTPLYPPDQDKNHQALIKATQIPKGWKAYGIESL